MREKETHQLGVGKEKGQKNNFAVMIPVIYRLSFA
jgi:hypothetical protein